MDESQWVMQVKSHWLKRLLRPPARLALRLLSRLEARLWANARLRYSPVFIVAPPRAGTTLLYQLMTGHLDTSYFTNLAMRMHVQDDVVAPIIGALLTRWLVPRRHDGTFESYYGATRGWNGPHEGHWVWNQFFPDDAPSHYVPPGYLAPRQRRDLYRIVAGTERVFGRPFVSKHIRNSVRIQALAEVFPTALFIQCQRDPLDTAQSIYIARTRDLPFVEHAVRDPARWWFSVKPREYAEIKDKGLVAQVCEQVYAIQRQIVQDRAVLGQERFLTVKYSDLCQRPQDEMERVVAFMTTHNAPTRILKPIPQAFPFSTGCKVEREVYQAMADYLERLYEKGR